MLACDVPQLLTATVFPGVVFAIFFTLNLMIWGDQVRNAA
jgi:hypothetical protein